MRQVNWIAAIRRGIIVVKVVVSFVDHIVELVVWESPSFCALFTLVTVVVSSHEVLQVQRQRLQLQRVLEQGAIGTLLVEKYVRRVGWFEALQLADGGVRDVTVVELEPRVVRVPGVGEVVASIHAVARVDHRRVQVILLVLSVVHQRVSAQWQLYRFVVDNVVAEFGTQPRLGVVAKVL